MTESSDPQPNRPVPPAELHWGISYLREDIQDARQASRDESRATNERMDSRFAETHERMDSRFTETHAHMDSRFAETNARMDSCFAEINKRIDSRFALLMTLMIAMTGVLLAAIKL